MLDAPGRRRLGEIEPRGGTVDGPGFGHRDEGFDVLKVHRLGT
jgi:hypothetical protein